MNKSDADNRMCAIQLLGCVVDILPLRSIERDIGGAVSPSKYSKAHVTVERWWNLQEQAA